MDRPLSNVEQAWDLLCDLGPMNTAVTARVTGPLAAPVLRAALDRLQARHPLLRVCIAGAGPAARLAPTAAAIPLRVLPRRADGQWAEVCEEELNAPFARGVGPLLRATLLAGAGDSEIVLALHHAVTDGRGNVALVRDLLVYCREELGGREPGPGPLPAWPPAEALVPAWARGAARLAGYLLRLSQQQLRRPLLPPLGPNTGRRRSRVLPRRLAPGPVAALLARCRAEGAPVDGALGAAMVLAVAGERPAPIGCVFFRDLRPELAPPVGRAHLGCYVTLIGTVPRATAATPFWDLARALGTELAAATRRGDGFSGLRAILPLVRLYLARPAPLIAAAGVSNIGRVDIPVAYGPLRLQELHGCSSVNGLAPACMALVTTLAGELYWNFTCPEPLLDAAAGNRLADTAVARLLAAVAA